MSGALQVVVVFAIVAIATLYATLKFMPASWRRRFAARAASWVQRSGVTEVTARRVEAKLASGGACGSCDSCKACVTTPDPDSASIATTYRQIPIRRAT